MNYKKGQHVFIRTSEGKAGSTLYVITDVKGTACSIKPFGTEFAAQYWDTSMLMQARDTQVLDTFFGRLMN